MTPTVLVHVRPGCHLCDDALGHLLRLQGELSFSLQTSDIERDDADLRRYMERIPVICLDGEELSDFFVDEALLRARLGA